MPEQARPKIKPHPWKHLAPGEYTGGESACDEAYTELHVTSNFTFLRGASHPEELVQQAAKLGHCAATITDCNTLAGIVRAHLAAKEVGIPLVVGCRLALQSSHSMLVYPTNRAAYSRLCRLLTLGKRRTTKGQCELTLHDLIEHHEGLLAIVVPPAVLDQDFIDVVSGLKPVFDDDRLSIASSCLYGSDDRERLDQLIALSEHVGVPLVATNDVHYHVAHRRALQDVLTCIRLGCSLPEVGLRLFAHAERHLKPARKMVRLFTEHPQAITRTVEIAKRAAAFNLDELRYQYPDEVCPAYCTPMQYLIDLTWQGAAKHYPQGVPEKVRRQIENEFTLIAELNYAPYFLTVYDLVVFARSRGILCQGRGAAANSAVCYCLGVTAVDPDRIDLLFERFISRERNEPPDIDIDFEHERREEVIQYIYSKYGRERAALTAEVITYRGKSAVREVGKALGLSLDCVDRLSKSMDWWEKGKLRPDRIRQLGLNPNEPTIHHLVRLMNEILGFPRHLSQHVGGFVITKGPLCELVPIENAAMKDRTVIEWDKDDIDAMGMLKVDVLGLGMLTCIRKAFEFVNHRYLAPGEYTGGGGPPCIHGGLNGERRKLELHAVPPEDPAVYDMICSADTIGVFQIESRAQMSMLPRLRPRCFYDLVIEVAIVRPGPIQGKMVHPYLRRRNGEEPVTYPDESVKEVLGRTLGVPLFQEQAMRLAMVGAGFTPDEADQLRRAMAAWKRKGNQIEQFGKRLIDGMLNRGYPLEFAQRCFEQIKGFSDYGFPESHAASFALLVYVSAWLKKHHPAAFAAALINSQPMGFYAPAQIVRDAQNHGVEIHPVDVNCSQWDCTLEDATTLRLGMRLIKGLREDDANAISQAVDRYGALTSIESLWRASGVRIATLRALAKADAFGSMRLDRQAALWESRKLRDEVLPLFDGKGDNLHLAPGEYTGGSGGERDALPPIPQPRKVVQDYAATGLSLKAHPISFIRSMLESRGAIEAVQLKDHKRYPQGAVVSVAGIVLVRQRPATASGIIFMTLEDETDIANLIIRPHIYDRFRPAARHGVIILARGKVERQGEVIHILVDHVQSIEWPAEALQTSSRDFH